jgi:hypothetical protein
VYLDNKSPVHRNIARISSVGVSCVGLDPAVFSDAVVGHGEPLRTAVLLILYKNGELSIRVS